MVRRRSDLFVRPTLTICRAFFAPAPYCCSVHASSPEVFPLDSADVSRCPNVPTALFPSGCVHSGVLLGKPERPTRCPLRPIASQRFHPLRRSVTPTEATPRLARKLDGVHLELAGEPSPASSLSFDISVRSVGSSFRCPSNRGKITSGESRLTSFPSGRSWLIGYGYVYRFAVYVYRIHGAVNAPVRVPLARGTFRAFVELQECRSVIQGTALETVRTRDSEP